MYVRRNGVRGDVDMDRRLLAGRADLVGARDDRIDNAKPHAVLAPTVAGARREHRVVHVAGTQVCVIELQLAEQPAVDVDVAHARFGLRILDEEAGLGQVSVFVIELAELGHPRACESQGDDHRSPSPDNDGVGVGLAAAVKVERGRRGELESLRDRLPLESGVLA